MASRHVLMVGAAALGQTNLAGMVIQMAAIWIVGLAGIASEAFVYRSCPMSTLATVSIPMNVYEATDAI
jgi:hypothetical protein